MNLEIMAAVLALVTAMLMKSDAAEAAPCWPWCSLYGFPSLGRACAFSSFEQCMETFSGIGGCCYVNPCTPPVRSPGTRRRSRG
jgi:hypothetical protein